MGLLANKTAIITGSSRGFGLAIARAFAREGAAVVISSRNQAAVDQAVRDLQSKGGKAAGIACDTGSLDEVQRLAEFTRQTFGRIDVWVNNAAFSTPYGPTLGTDPAEFERAVRTNILGVYHGSITALDGFVRQGSGKLINVLGRGSDRPAPMQNAYGSSKIWVLWFSKALAEETRGKGVEVLTINPGMMLTDLLTDVEVIAGYEEKLRPYSTIIRMWAKPPEFAAEKMVWLASTATDGKSGLTVKVMNPGMMLSGAFKEGWRRLFRLPGPEMKLKIRTVDGWRSNK
jgi:NAD(P)-dependent dehydrogenase (short-subunit alcohol dehydrogenase family)